VQKQCSVKYQYDELKSGLFSMIRFMSLILAYFFLALAIVGALLPGIPTVPFLLLTAWFSARGSKRLHNWLYEHPYLGKPIIDWEEQGAVSRKSKVIAVIMIIVGWIVMYHRLNNMWVVIGVTILLMAISLFLVSRPEPVISD
jgi:uncharacterized membrane protein YbaN (DUF454 family)